MKGRRVQWCAAKWEQSKWILLEWQLKNGCYGFTEAPFHPCNAHLHFSFSKHAVSIGLGVEFYGKKKECNVKCDFPFGSQWMHRRLNLWM